MHDLNSQQIVLLTLLVSFVTSIATGIVTVSLLEQAPEPVTQTINRVVERTVERVVPAEGSNQQEKVVETVVVKEEDLTISAVDNNSKSLVRIFETNGGVETFIALGVVISEDGQVLTDALNIRQNADYVGKFVSGSYPLKVTYREVNKPFAKLKASSETKFTPAKFANSQNLKLGQSVIALSGQNENVVSTGIITSLQSGYNTVKETTDTQSEKIFTAIETSVNGSKIVAGSILLNLQGEIVGAKISGNPIDYTTFLPSKNITDFLASNTTQTN